MGTSILTIKNLTKHYKELKALNRVSFDVNKGEIFVIVGPNGAGKTSLIEIIEGIRSFQVGEISLCGYRPGHNELKKIMGVQLEDFQFDKDLKVKEIFGLFNSFYGSNFNIQNILESLKLTEKKETYYKNLSKGMRQRVSIGIAILHNPDIIFLDEISSGLDPQARRNIWSTLEKIKQKGQTIILTTHYMEEADYLADKILLLVKGTVVMLDTPQGIKETFKFKNKVVLKGSQIDAGKIDIEFELFDSGTRLTFFTNFPKQLKKKLLELSYSSSKIELLPITLEDIFLFYTNKEQ